VQYLAVAVVVFGVNLLPAFGPPTWAVLVLFKLNWHLNAVALVCLGAVAAAAGRYCLAIATSHFKSHLPRKRVENLKAAGDYLKGHKARSVVGLALFAVSPLPSAQLFEAAALLGVPLVPVTAAFFVGRLVSYSLYVGGATAAERSFGDTFQETLTSPYAIALEVAMVVGIVLLGRIDWSKHLGKKKPAKKRARA
jgi:membrane protein YqaA with SNARE-associated domain